MPVSVGVTVERKLNDYLGIETGLLLFKFPLGRAAFTILSWYSVKINVTLLDTKKADLLRALQ